VAPTRVKGRGETFSGPLYRENKTMIEKSSSEVPKIEKGSEEKGRERRRGTELLLHICKL
jgi:hypothetical protein